MHIIIFPIDFAGFSQPALDCAVLITERVSGTLLLLHVHQLPVTLNESAILPVSPEELKANAEAELNRLKNNLIAKFASLSVNTESRLGDLSDELDELRQQLNPLVVVLGHHHLKGLERLFFSDEASSVIRKSKIPVFVCPDAYHSPALTHILLAVDQLPDTARQTMVLELAQLLNAKVSVIHVSQNEEARETVQNIIPGLSDSLQVIKDNDFIGAINKCQKEKQVDVIALFPHHHAAVERWVVKTHTSEILESVSIPVLCIPPIHNGQGNG